MKVATVWTAKQNVYTHTHAANRCPHVQLQKCRNWGNAVSRFLFKCADIFSSDYRRNICCILLWTSFVSLSAGAMPPPPFPRLSAALDIFSYTNETDWLNVGNTEAYLPKILAKFTTEGVLYSYLNKSIRKAFIFTI